MNVISVVVPVYRVEKYLDRCIQSLLRQTLTDIEIILVDDGSPDRCPALCDDYASKHANIRVVHKKNGGLGMACNSGLDVATGRYVAFLDSDDWVDPEMYEVLLRHAEQYNAQMVFSGLKRVNDRGDVVPMSDLKEIRVHETAGKIHDFMLDMIASSPSEKKERKVQMSAKVVLYERAFIERHHIRFESERKFISEDLLFNLDIIQFANCIVELPYMFYNYYVNDDSLSMTFRKDRFEKYVILRQELLSRYKNVPDDFATRVNRLFIGYVRSAVCSICATSQIGWRDKRSLVREIVRNSLWTEIKANYPIGQMPITHKLFFFCLIWNLFVPLYFMTKIKR